MGLVSYTGRAREGQTGCEATEWESETSLRCLQHSALRGTRRVQMTLSERSSSVTQSWSADVAGVSLAGRGNQAGTGSASLTVHGASMGLVSYSGSVRYGQTGCESTEWESETSVRCMLGGGSQGTRRVFVTVGERGRSMTQSWSLEIAGLSITRHGNQGGTGSASITVHGTAIGLSAHTTKGREGQTGCEASEWESESSVRCRAGSGALKTKRVVLTAGTRAGSSTQALSMDIAGISFSHRANGGATGSASVTVHGAGMGLVSYTGRAREGQTGCEATEWESETSMRCMGGLGVRGTRRVAMTAGARGGTLTQSWSVDVVLTSRLRRLNRAGTGSASVTVHGAGMGLVSYTGRAREGQTGCEATEWESETSMRCRFGHGSKRTRRVAMTVGDCQGAGLRRDASRARQMEKGRAGWGYRGLWWPS
jgi:hypothetical protein